MSNKQVVRIYACGGTGINIVNTMDKGSMTDHGVGFAKTMHSYIDTSEANLLNKDSIKHDDVFLYGRPDGAYVIDKSDKEDKSKKIDGSGKVRTMNYDEVVKNTKAVLLKHKPTMFNIVVHSSGGGSGSIIGPAIVSELKARNSFVIVIIVGSTDTRIEIDNSIKTIKTYESLAQKFGTPVVAHYIENSKAGRAEIDQTVRRHISLLLGLFSGENIELDTADLRNWLDYTKVTNARARLAHLDCVFNNEKIHHSNAPISVATLAMPGMSTRVEPTPAYQCVGYAPNEWRSDIPNGLKIVSDNPIHYCISDDYCGIAIEKLTKLLSELDDIISSRNERKSLLDRSDNPTVDGFIV